MVARGAGPPGAGKRPQDSKRSQPAANNGNQTPDRAQTARPLSRLRSATSLDPKCARENRLKSRRLEPRNSCPHHVVLRSLSAPLAQANSCDSGFHRARRIDIDMEEGEVRRVDAAILFVQEISTLQVLFVPGGAPHLVVNLTDTVAFAGNFLDDSNLEAGVQFVKNS